MRVLLVVLLLAGCAFHARLGEAPAISACAFYCRVTDCPGQPLPAPLTPQAAEPGTPVAQTPCDDTEVGSKSYSDTITAIGVIVGALAMAGLLF